MARQRGKGGKHQVDGRGGGYALFPHATMDALMALVSPRAVVAFHVILRRFNGFNNGEIGVSMRDLAATCGPDNPANTRAIKELVEAGFIRATRFPKGQRRATEYRFTHISYGASGERPATHDYLDVLETKNSTVWESHTREAEPVLPSHTREKRRVLLSHTGATETSQFPEGAPVLESHTHIVHHPQGSADTVSASSSYPDPAPAPEGPSAAMDQQTLRRLAMAFLSKSAAGTQTQVAHRSGVPGGVLSKFLKGQPLPEKHMINLQLELGRRGALTGQPASPVNDVDPCHSGTPVKSLRPRNYCGGGSEPVPQKGETVPLSGPLEKIGRCVGSPILIDPALPSPPWRRILTPDVTRYAPLLQPGAAA